MFFLNQFYLKLNLLHKNFLARKKYFSFSGVDIIIENIFRNQNNGFYIDVGCQHPIKNNNTFLLHKKGWFGINIDLDKDNIDLFNSSRPNDENINIAVSDDIKDVDLYFYHKKSPINTIDLKTSKFQKAKVSNIKKIRTNTLSNIISSSKFKNVSIDLLSVDVEGHEIQVFEGFDFVKYSPNVIIVEYLDLNISKLEVKNLSIKNIINSEIYKLLSSKNYTLVNCIYSDLIFINNNFRD